jgi:hypothetical protein
MLQQNYVELTKMHFCFTGVLVMGIGSITFSLPHFLTGNHILGSLGEGHNNSMGNICVRNNHLMAAPKTQTSAGEELLMSLPGIEKIKSLTEGKNFKCSLNIVQYKFVSFCNKRKIFKKHSLHKGDI